MILYHGSTEVIRKPEILENTRMLDFGKGFYTMTDRQQAALWAQKASARRQIDTKLISIYEFDLATAEKELNILRFNRPDAAWMDFVSTCRRGKHPDNNYDIVWGPAATDKAYVAFQLYEIGILRKREMLKYIKKELFPNQILFHTERSLEFCFFKESIFL